MRQVVSQASNETAEFESYYIDRDQSPDVAAVFGIHTIPTVVLIDQQKELKRVVGPLTREQLNDFLQTR